MASIIIGAKCERGTNVNEKNVEKMAGNSFALLPNTIELVRSPSCPSMLFAWPVCLPGSGARPSPVGSAALTTLLSLSLSLSLFLYLNFFVLFLCRGEDCYKCAVFHQKAANVLQYKESKSAAADRKVSRIQSGN
jgi:hypothetical protein